MKKNTKPAPKPVPKSAIISAIALVRHGNELYDKNDIDEAIADYQKAVELVPNINFTSQNDFQRAIYPNLLMIYFISCS